MTNSQKIVELQAQIATIEQQLHDYYPGRLSSEDFECLSDRHQAMLEYNEYAEEQQVVISELQADIAHLRTLPAIGTWIDDAANIEEIEWPVVDGLRYVSEEVGYVDQDEEYR